MIKSFSQWLSAGGTNKEVDNNRKLRVERTGSGADSFHSSDIRPIQDMTFHSLNSTFQTSVTKKMHSCQTKTLWLDSDLCHFIKRSCRIRSHGLMKVLNDSSICSGEWMKNILVRVLIQKWVSLFTSLCRQDLDKTSNM